MTEAPLELPDPALRVALFEDAVGALHERRVAPIVELCRAAGPQLLKMRTAKKGNTMLHLAPSAVIAEVLLCLGADALALNADGQTPRECVAPDNAELVAVLRAAEQNALRRAPAVPSSVAVALAAADDDVQILELLRQALRTAQAEVAAERCAQSWSTLQGQHLVAAEVLFRNAGLTPPQTVATSAPATLPSEDRCPPARLRVEDTEPEVVKQVETMMTRTVELIEGLIAEDRVAREQAGLQQQELHASLMQAAQSLVQTQGSAEDACSTRIESGAIDAQLDVEPVLVRQRGAHTAETCTKNTSESFLNRFDSDEYEDLHDAIQKTTSTRGAEKEERCDDGANSLDTIPTTTVPLAAPAANTELSHLEQWFAADQVAQDTRDIEVADALPSAMASDRVGPPVTDDGVEIANSEQIQPTEVHNPPTAAASVGAQTFEDQTFQEEPPLSSIELQQENAPISNLSKAPDLELDTGRETGDPSPMETRVASKPRPADAQEAELPRHERKALIERHKRVKMVQTMFDKYARRDERSPAGAMGRKELSQLSKDSGSARIDSAYFRDTCEALRADPDVGIRSEHLAQLYLDGGAWSATLVSDYKKIFGTKRVKAIAPPVAARPDELNAFVTGSRDDLDEV